MRNVKQIIKRVYEVQGSVFDTDEEGQLLSTTTTDYLENGEPALDTYFQEDCGMGHETRYEHGKPVSQSGDLFTDYVYDDEGRLVSSTTDTGAGFGIINRYQYNDDGSWVEYEYHDHGFSIKSEVSHKRYDKDGNLVYERCDANEFTGEGPNNLDYEYDSDHRLIGREGILDGEYHVARYYYNEQGQRIRMLTAANDWSLYEGDEDTDEDTELDEAPMRFEEVEYQYHADGTWAKITTYCCQAPSLDAFLNGDYTRELFETQENTVEEVIQGDSLVRTTKEYVDGVLQTAYRHIYSHPDGELLKATRRSLERHTITIWEYQYW